MNGPECGGIIRLRPKPGRERELIALIDEWRRERAPGARASYALTPGRCGDRLSVAVFGARARDIAHDHWHGRLRDALEAEPEWVDGAGGA
jgi:hypothetical protein